MKQHNNTSRSSLIKNAANRLVPTIVNGQKQIPFLGVNKYKPVGHKAKPLIRTCIDYPEDGNKIVRNLKDALKKESSYRVSELVEDGEALLAAAGELGLEGIKAKDKNSKYIPGRRSDSWYKIKVRQTAESHIIGYTVGKGNREEYFGALNLGDISNGEIVYRGKVGTGFDSKIIEEITVELKKLKETKKQIKEKVLDEKQTVWVQPKLVCEIQYSSITRDGAFREAVFVRLRPDLA